MTLESTIKRLEEENERLRQKAEMSVQEINRLNDLIIVVMEEECVKCAKLDTTRAAFLAEAVEVVESLRPPGGVFYNDAYNQAISALRQRFGG